MASYCLGRKERGFFITLRRVLSFYRYSLGVFLIGLKAYLLKKQPKHYLRTCVEVKIKLVTNSNQMQGFGPERLPSRDLYAILGF